MDRLIRALQKKKVRFALAGGWAVALHGAVRGTLDVDLVLKIDIKNFERAEAALGELGLKSRHPITASDVFHFRKEYIQNKNMEAWSFVNPDQPSELVDIIITHDLTAMKIHSMKKGGLTLPVLAIDDLIHMKKESGRPQDLEDVKALKTLKK